MSLLFSEQFFNTSTRFSGSSYTFPASPGINHFSSGKFHFSGGYLETKIWVLSVLSAPLWTETGNICMHRETHTFIFPYLSMYIIKTIDSHRHLHFQSNITRVILIFLLFVICNIESENLASIMLLIWLMPPVGDCSSGASAPSGWMPSSCLGSDPPRQATLHCPFAARLANALVSS